MLIGKKCPKCGKEYCCMIMEMKNRRVVFDACTKCGVKLTDIEEIVPPKKEEPIQETQSDE